MYGPPEKPTVLYDSDEYRGVGGDRGGHQQRRGKSAVCPRSLYQFYMVTFYIKWVKTFWTYNKNLKEIHI